MKSTLKATLFKSALFICFVLVMNTANSQLGVAKVVTKPGATLGLNFVYSMPQGDFKQGFDYGVGGEVYGGVGWGKTYLIATVGYTSYKTKNSNIINGEKLTYIPIKVGVKQMFLMKRLFVQGDVGMASVKYLGVSDSKLAYGFGAGVRLAGLELGAYYDNFKIGNSTVNALNGKLGWNFSL